MSDQSKANYYRGVADAMGVIRAYDFPFTERVDAIAEALAPNRPSDERVPRGGAMSNTTVITQRLIEGARVSVAKGREGWYDATVQDGLSWSSSRGKWEMVVLFDGDARLTVIDDLRWVRPGKAGNDPGP